jgi:hypothetical protein
VCTGYLLDTVATLLLIECHTEVLGGKVVAQQRVFIQKVVWGWGRTRAELEQRPHGGKLPRAAGIGEAGRIVGVDLREGEVQRGGPLLPLPRSLNSSTLQLNLSRV